MAGEERPNPPPESSANANSNPHSNAGPKSNAVSTPVVPKPKVKTFSCKSCGASVEVKYPGTSMSVVCQSCHALIDLTDPNFKILYTSKGRYRHCFRSAHVRH